MDYHRVTATRPAVVRSGRSGAIPHRKLMLYVGGVDTVRVDGSERSLHEATAKLADRGLLSHASLLWWNSSAGRNLAFPRLHHPAQFARQGGTGQGGARNITAIERAR
jgi:hypothetical protein